MSATFIGVHDHDDGLPDLSESGVGDVLASTATLRRRLGTLADGRLPWPAEVDRRLAAGFLDIQEWEYAGEHFYRTDPSLYVGEAAFGVIGLFLAPFAPLEERVRSATARMEAVRTFLAQARANVRAAPRAWIERAIRECAGATAFFTEGVDRLAHGEGIEAPSFRRAADAAAAAVADHRHHLETELLPEHATERYACGGDALALLLQRGHLLEWTADEIALRAEAELAEAEAALTARAAESGAATWRDAMRALEEHHPTVDSYQRRFEDLREACREAAERSGLLTWIDWPLRFVPQPEWARQAAPYLYFLPYRSPPAYGAPMPHRYLIPAIDESLPADRREWLLRETNDSVIKLNHVVHHGSVGHHFQNWHASRAASRIGRVAGVDCAARIALFCGGTMTEGWATYAVEVMGETDLFTPLERVAVAHGRLRMAARALVDVRLHQGRLAFEEAVRLYQERVGMSAVAARAEAVKNSMFPGTGLMYLVGADFLRDLRRRVTARGALGSLRGFHDRVLAYGSIPVTLVTADILGSAGAVPGARGDARRS